MTPDSLNLINTLSMRMGTQLGGPNTANTYWYLPPQLGQPVAIYMDFGVLPALTGEANTRMHMLYLVP